MRGSTNWVGPVMMTIFVLAIFIFPIWLEWYRFDECRTMGHSYIYCITSIGR